jgi:hypothetical protein
MEKPVKRLVLVLCLIGAGTTVEAQTPYNLSAPVNKLATLFTDLYGPNGLVVDSLATLPGEQAHTAHFVSDFQFNFSQFSTALVSQLVTVPLPSPASGFTFQLDPATGVFERSTQSFGPILTERADTIGAGRVSFGSAYQRFTFDTVEGLDLLKVPAVFTHDNAQLLGGREDVVTTLNAIESTISQFTAFLTMGVTDRFDVSLAVPVVSTDLRVVSTATIQRLGTINPLTHFYRQSDAEVGNQRLFTASGSASGLGDLTVRMKSTLARRSYGNFGVGLDVRLPTGDEMDLLGTGTVGLQPFAVWSATLRKVSPHVNLGYTWNGSSLLAGNPATGESADFPDLVSYAVGADVAVNSRLTVVFDVLGRYLIDAERLVQQDFHALDGRSVFPNIVFTKDSFNSLRGAIGFKTGLADRLLVDVNLLFALDNNGLADKVTPLVGIEYAF